MQQILSRRLSWGASISDSDLEHNIVGSHVQEKSPLQRFQGASTALITPLYDGSYKPNFDELERLVEFQLTNGIHNLVPLGTTGQGPLLKEIDFEEWKQVLRKVIAITDDRVPIIAGCGSIPTSGAIHASETARELGADALLHDTGYKIRTSQEGFRRYFAQVNELELPTVVYDVRGRGHPAIWPETRIQIALESPNVYIIKEASGSRDEQKETRRLAREHHFTQHTYIIVSGDDPLTYHMWVDSETEARGVISVWANILPHIYSRMVEHLARGEYEQAIDIHNTLTRLSNEEPLRLNNIVGVTVPYNVLGKTQPDNYANPEAVQFAAYLLGMIDSPTLISPLGVMPQEGQKTVGDVIYRLYDERSEWFRPIEEFFDVKVGERLNPYHKRTLF